MRFPGFFLLLFLTVWHLASVGTAHAWEVVEYKYRDYVKISELAEFYRMTYKPDGASFRCEAKNLKLEGKSASKTIKLNGLTFHLFHPVASHDKGLLLSTYDLATLIDPLLNPIPRNAQDGVGMVRLLLSGSKEERESALVTTLIQDAKEVLVSQKFLVEEGAIPLDETSGQAPPPPPTRPVPLPEGPRDPAPEVLPANQETPPTEPATPGSPETTPPESSGETSGRTGGPMQVVFRVTAPVAEPSITIHQLIPPGSPKDEDANKPWDIENRVFLGNMWDSENLQLATLVTGELLVAEGLKDWETSIDRGHVTALRSADCPAVLLEIAPPKGWDADSEKRQALARSISVALAKTALRMDAILKRHAEVEKALPKGDGVLHFASLELLTVPEEDDVDREYDFGLRLGVGKKGKEAIDARKIDLQVFAVDVFNEVEINLTAALPPNFLWMSNEPDWKSGDIEVVDVIYRYPRIWELVGEKSAETGEKKTPPKSKPDDEDEKDEATEDSLEESPAEASAAMLQTMLTGRVRNYGFVARLVYDGKLVDEAAFPRPLKGHLGWFATLWPPRER
jgi:hypothetical protein